MVFAAVVAVAVVFPAVVVTTPGSSHGDRAAGYTAPTTAAPAPVHRREHGDGVVDVPPYRIGEVIPAAREWDGPAGTVRETGVAEVALTFDDGPHPDWTPKVLASLRRHGVRATFCVVGVQARAYPELLRSIVADGHTLCNHSWRHSYDLGSRSESAIRADLERTNEAIRAAVPHARIGYFRQPGGAWTDRVVRVARELGMVPIHWSVDPGDWNAGHGAARIARDVVAHTGPGGIVLLHDGGGDRGATHLALESILPELTARFRLIALPPPEEERRGHFGGMYPTTSRTGRDAAPHGDRDGT
ncbi:hypothetical protein GCM10023223_20580 [Stackebrandtia albiflava]